MTDGYSLFMINQNGKLKESEHCFYDKALYEINEDGEDLRTEQIADQLPGEYRDVLIFATYSYKAFATYDAYEGDYDLVEEYTLRDVSVLKDNYKEFYRKQLSMEFRLTEGDGLPEEIHTWLLEKSGAYEQAVLEDVETWENLYEETFEPVKIEMIEQEEQQHLKFNLYLK